MKRLSLIAALVAVAAVWPAASGAATFKGIVVAKQHGSLLVASPSGAVSSVSGRAAIGSRVSVFGGHAAVIGRAHSAHIRGVVVKRVGSTLFVSSNHHLVAMHTGRVLASANDQPPAPTTPAPSSPTPAPGTIVSSQVTIQGNGELDEESSEDVGQTSSNTLQVQAVVASVGVGSVTLTVGSQTLTVPLPIGLTLPAAIVGQTVTLSIDLNGGNDQGDDNSGDNGGGNGGGGDD